MVEKIRAFVIENYLFGENGTLKDDDSFIETGIIDSTGILELVRFIESTFGIKIADEDLVPDNLDSINKIVAFLHAKTTPPASAVSSLGLQPVQK